MQKLLRRLLPLVALASLVPLVAPAPAQAHEDHCVGVFTATFSKPLGLPSIGVTKLFTFTITLTTGTCAAKGRTFTMSGDMIGNCYDAAGGGYTDNLHEFEVVWSGPTMTFSREVKGTLYGTDALPECATNTAMGDTLVGALLKTHIV